MNTRLPTYDKLPWYKQFWPWFLISLPASVVVAGFITLYIANKHSDDLVADEPYKEGLAINRQLEKKLVAEQRGITARLLFTGVGNERRVEVRITGPSQDEGLKLALSHPLEADRDFEIPLQFSGSDLYIGRLAKPVSPRWHWILVSTTATPWRLDGSVSQSDFSNEPND